jgi:hypothetical protein
LAAAEQLDRGYLGRILMLTLLAPDIVAAITDSRQPAELGLHVLREGFPVEWGGSSGDSVCPVDQELPASHDRRQHGVPNRELGHGAQMTVRPSQGATA